MSTTKCAICGKTAYPLESVNAIGKTYHKGCFKCCEPSCKLTLTLKNYKGLDGKIYCNTHIPKAKATQVTDSVDMKHALTAPKKESEALGTVQKGVGGKPQIAVFGADGSNAPAGEQPTEEPAEEQPAEEQPAEEQPTEEPPQ
eukprot:TRINITY_DN18790_c0_g1_i1.p2 TRINITY_DN18790_c0_g1~~TRINITY_DN18790_c0_g1_i1.p2  ORF type:complete len:143 (+),score=55.01 TRINITY_DN18790_c0_g1_i1:68-496(+)